MKRPFPVHNTTYPAAKTSELLERHVLQQAKTRPPVLSLLTRADAGTFETCTSTDHLQARQVWWFPPPAWCFFAGVSRHAGHESKRIDMAQSNSGNDERCLRLNACAGFWLLNYIVPCLGIQYSDCTATSSYWWGHSMSPTAAHPGPI